MDVLGPLLSMFSWIPYIEFLFLTLLVVLDAAAAKVEAAADLGAVRSPARR